METKNEDFTAAIRKVKAKAAPAEVAPVELPAPEPVDPVSVAQEKIAALKAAKSEAVREVQLAQARVAAIDTELAQAQNALSQLRPPLNEVERYRLVVKRGQEERRERLRAQALMPQGPRKSRIDQVLGARRAPHGGRRPNYNGAVK